MKKDIHPDYHDITVVMTNGTSFTTRSTWGKKGDKLKLDVDRTTHPAWTGGGLKLVDTGGQLKRFQKRFAAVGMRTQPTASAPGKEAAADSQAKKPPREAGEGKTAPDSESKKPAVPDSESKKSAAAEAVSADADPQGADSASPVSQGGEGAPESAEDSNP